MLSSCTPFKTALGQQAASAVGETPRHLEQCDAVTHVWYSGTPYAPVPRMPTINPRINVTLSPSLDLLVQRMAVHQRVSKSQVLRELLEAAEPALQRAVILMDAASKASGQVLSGLADRMTRDQDLAEQQAAAMLARLDSAHHDLVSQAEQIEGRRPKRRAPRSVPRSSDPPASNRGVKSVKTERGRATAGGRK
jgi:hypothetical protein